VSLVPVKRVGGGELLTYFVFVVYFASGLLGVLKSSSIIIRHLYKCCQLVGYRFSPSVRQCASPVIVRVCVNLAK